MGGRAILLGTFDTKSALLSELSQALERNALEVEPIDLSLRRIPQFAPVTHKLELMREAIKTANERVRQVSSERSVVIGLGGGTGAEMILSAMRAFPADVPKVLITTMAFDPRPMLADCAVTLIPTLCDLEGRNQILDQVINDAARVAAALNVPRQIERRKRPQIAITSLGVTADACDSIVKLLAEQDHEPVVFHANGYGGAAFTRFVREGAPAGVIDLTIHELGRLHIAGAHVPMPDRISAASHVPRIVLPGGVNFLGLGAMETISDAYLMRDHYRHTEQFTHIKLNVDEIKAQGERLALDLNQSVAPCHVLLPMGGFSNEDRPGGAIEDPEMREAFAQVLERNAQSYTVKRLPYHINAPETAQVAVSSLNERLSHERICRPV